MDFSRLKYPLCSAHSCLNLSSSVVVLALTLFGLWPWLGLGHDDLEGISKSWVAVQTHLNVPFLFVLLVLTTHFHQTLQGQCHFSTSSGWRCIASDNIFVWPEVTSRAITFFMSLYVFIFLRHTSHLAHLVWTQLNTLSVLGLVLMYFCWLRLSLLHYSLCMDLTSTVCPFLLTSVFFNIFIPLAPPLQFSGNSTSCSSRFLFNHTLSPSTFPHCSLSSPHFYPSHLTQFSPQAPPLPTPHHL